MQVECRDDRHVRPDDVADALEHDAFGVVLLGRDRRAMGAEIDAIDRHRGFEPARHRMDHFLEKAVLDRPIRLAHRQYDTDRGPRRCRIHRRDKTRRFGQHRRGRAARLVEDCLTLEISARRKMRLCRGRREFVALDRKAENGDPRIGRSGHGCHRLSIAVIASEAKQSRADLFHRDCFVAALSAMTALGYRRNGWSTTAFCSGVSAL